MSFVSGLLCWLVSLQNLLCFGATNYQRRERFLSSCSWNKTQNVHLSMAMDFATNFKKFLSHITHLFFAVEIEKHNNNNSNNTVFEIWDDFCLQVNYHKKSVIPKDFKSLISLMQRKCFSFTRRFTAVQTWKLYNRKYSRPPWLDRGTAM